MLSNTVFLVLFLGLFGTDSAKINNVSPPDQNIFFGDPHILLVDDTYYMYGTSNNTGIEVYESTNLKDWEGPVGARNGLALHKEDVWGDKKFWAPEVYHIDGKFYMFFSVEAHIAVAVSDHPTGPFVQQNPSVLRDHRSIDNHLFIDDDGTKYIYFANFKKGLEIWGAELKDDFSALKEGTLTKLLSKSQEWEKSPKEPVGTVNEGPFVVKKGGEYYMTYSANHFASQDYGIGLAFAVHPLGDWTKSKHNPVMQTPDSLVGTGHSSFFKDKKGQRHIVYHAHHNKSKVHPRKVFINPVAFTKPQNANRYRLKILSPGIVPQVSSIKNR